MSNSTDCADKGAPHQKLRQHPKRKKERYFMVEIIDAKVLLISQTESLPG
jgi:hypothetical protein